MYELTLAIVIKFYTAIHELDLSKFGRAFTLSAAAWEIPKSFAGK